LFPLFTNRLLSRSRPDYEQYVQWLNVPLDQDDPIALLARNGGRRATDSFEVFPCPTLDEKGYYHIHFFAHGLRHLPSASVIRTAELQPGERLLLMHDFQNPYDSLALALRTDGGSHGNSYIVGYCPRYLLGDAFKILMDCPDSVHVAVERVNLPPAPLQLRLLCNMSACWPQDFTPFSEGQYEPLVALNPSSAIPGTGCRSSDASAPHNPAR
jgi:hypothetical protein